MDPRLEAFEQDCPWVDAPDADTTDWTLDQLTAYYESDGQVLPAAATPLEPAPLKRVYPAQAGPEEQRAHPAAPPDETAGSDEVVHTMPGDEGDGGTVLRVGGLSVRAAALTEASAVRVPWIRHAEASQDDLRVVRWMMQKLLLGQDMFLVGAPGAHCRRCALMCCALLHREVEYVAITRDTNEADLKQRRELSNGHVRYSDGAVVSAAVNGRVLVLEGIDKAERNVLPVINNLLENREMALEDGSFLMSPQAAAGAQLPPGWRAVHRGFVVIAIGQPTTSHPRAGSNALDPPLRSRFAAHFVSSPMAHSLHAGLSHSMAQELRMVVQAVEQFNREHEKKGMLVPLTAERLFTCSCTLAVIPGLSMMTELMAALPYKLTCTDQMVRKAVEALLSGFGASKTAGCGEWPVCIERKSETVCSIGFRAAVAADGPSMVHCNCGDAPFGTEHDGSAQAVRADSMSVGELKKWLREKEISFADCREKSELIQRVTKSSSEAAAVNRWPFVGGLSERSWALTASQASTVASILRQWAGGGGGVACVVGEAGSGKTSVAKQAAVALGYRRVVSMLCFKDMSAADLTVTRTTDLQGNTKWRDSPLLAAAVNGDVVLLEGVDRLHAGLLYSALGRLLTDCELQLPDGSLLVSSEHAEALARQSTNCENSVHLKVVHPSFRVVATAGLDHAGRALWCDDELLTLLHIYTIESPTRLESIQVLRSGCAEVSAEVADRIMRYTEMMRSAVLENHRLELLRVSMRALHRVGRMLDCTAATVPNAQQVVERVFGTRIDFMPTTIRQMVREMMGVAFESASKRAENQPQQDAELIRAKAERKKLENITIAARMARDYGGGRNDLETQIDAELRNVRNTTTAAEKAGRQALIEALQAAAPVSRALPIQVCSRVLTIGDVSVPLRAAPQEPMLVPNVHFVCVEQHVLLLRELLRDWSLGHELLLMGNQGVGKNKVTDHLLHLLDAEREYVQLHRDVTVASLTMVPTLKNGVLEWQDSALLRAVATGRVLVVDEADKAPLEVVCILKALAERGAVQLPDGRHLVRHSEAGSYDNALPIHPDFRMIVLANRPGYPFLGNDFFAECGDVFGSHSLPNPQPVDEMELLVSHAANVSRQELARLVALFVELRELFEKDVLAYPYSTRELVQVARHLHLFGQDGLEMALRNVLSFDTLDLSARSVLEEVLERHQFKPEATFSTRLDAGALSVGITHTGSDPRGDMSLTLDQSRDKTKDVDRTKSGKPPPPVAEKGPTHGEWDGAQHIGGNKWAGGSGGTGTAGLGGRAGPYRLDVGQKLVMLDEQQKVDGVSDESREAAKKMGEAAYQERLSEIALSEHDSKEYSALHDAVSNEVSQMRSVLLGHRNKQKERQWLRAEQGELDEHKLVDGITGATKIYKRRAEAAENSMNGSSSRPQLPKRIKFVVDVSGSMYTFNRLDRRLERLKQVAMFIFESFEGLEHKYDYAMVGHSGSGPAAVEFVEWGSPPQTPKERLQAVQKMAAHAQYCSPGDHTVEGTVLGIQDVKTKPADEYFVFVLSDADLERYGIDPADWSKALSADPEVHALAILLANTNQEGEKIKQAMQPGRVLLCPNTDMLAVTFKQIFEAVLTQ